MLVSYVQLTWYMVGIHDISPILAVHAIWARPNYSEAFKLLSHEVPWIMNYARRVRSRLLSILTIANITKQAYDIFIFKYSHKISQYMRF